MCGGNDAAAKSASAANGETAARAAELEDDVGRDGGGDDELVCFLIADDIVSHRNESKQLPS